MDLDWVQTFLVAAQEENFHRAAARLNLAQPTVTQQIRKLEQHLGMSLFERRGRRVVLTQAGRRFLGHARTLLDTFESGLDDLIRWHQGYRQRLGIAVSPLVATTVLPRWIRRFGAQHPQVEFDIQVMESRDILDSVLRQEAAVGLSRQAVRHAHAVCWPLYPDPVMLVAPPGSREAYPDLAALLQHLPVLSDNHPEYWDGILLSLRRRYPMVRSMRVTQVHVTIHWIQEGLGVSFLPASTVRTAIERRQLAVFPVPEDLPLPVAHTYLVHAAAPHVLAARFAELVRSDPGAGAIRA
ncbi:transcriptional regulator CitR (LysR family) [Candidatus Hydrogenisulfobacillus filiaventi]|uniref:Transcriptional regulator CitR (LysR family) n=1 Tax=Candidatus Hydrogenisulfobacillus filiaventi TaxID=2707344 RepID=A0A6F8ZGF9_9FIRM|nr:LysR family transcriptional regulator [Bacillota bacterium]CAB1128838.1 transcriptional regulator CitR (LysR family) [Candidatus Hydrogenisulfobacillus filiaventi]